MATKRTKQRETSKRTNDEAVAPVTAAPAGVIATALDSGEVAKRAYEIWCGKGCPAGTDVEDWLEAERQLQAERAKAAKAAARRPN